MKCLSSFRSILLGLSLSSYCSRMISCSFSGSTRERISWALSCNSERSLFYLDALKKVLEADLGGATFDSKRLGDVEEGVRVFSGKNAMSSVIFLSRECDL